MTQLSGAPGVVEGQGQGQAAGSTSEPTPSPDDHAKDHADSMSGPELSERAWNASLQFQSSSQEGPATSNVHRATHLEEEDKEREVLKAAGKLSSNSRAHEPPLETPNREIPFAHMRVHFADFAKQLRLHRHHEHRKRMLLHRRKHLQHAVALSARLHRVGYWVHDGLVEISKQLDSSGFTRVHQHMHDLVDLCFSQWDHEIHALDSTFNPQPTAKESFLAKLPAASQEDCLELVQTLRSNPRFLVERFKAMSAPQISALSTSPRFQALSESVLTSLSQNRGRGSQRKRIKSYSKDLEDYAASFERSNPLSFLLHNIYGSFDDIQGHESQLRLSTWSTICSSLMMDFEEGFNALIGQVLSAFAQLHEWPIKDRLELFLMGSLQRGAFLFDLTGSSATGLRSDPGLLDSFNTPQAQEFFDAEVKELFEILGCEGGIPEGALRLCCAIIGKLPTLESQSQLRGKFFFDWFLTNFLFIAVAHPEDEKMLLNFHITDKARQHLLYQLWDRAVSRAKDVFNAMPARPVDPDVQKCVLSMINQLDADTQCSNPYQTKHPPSADSRTSTLAFISICAPDIVHVLEGLSPQFIHTSSPWDSFLKGSHSTFNAQYSRASSKFDKLRRRILDVIEPGQSSKNVHPCQESWASVLISPDGSMAAATISSSSPATKKIEGLGELHPVEDAALRLVERAPIAEDREAFDPIPSAKRQGSSLFKMFSTEARLAHIKTDSIMSMYWQSALDHLQLHYPLTVLTEDDTKVLGPLTDKVVKCQLQVLDDCFRTEQEVADLEAVYTLAKTKITRLIGWLDKLRIKLWYTMEVVPSKYYEDARNIATALNNMALSAIRGFVPVSEPGFSPDRSSRPSTSGTSVSSFYDQGRMDTMSLLKAPVEHGGPKKLSDAQIEMTRKWLERNHVDNFCKGEERIHRFCMEVKMATRKLVGETISDSPVLWSSELFVREKNFYDIHSGTFFSGQPSTRAPSVWSEPLSSSSYPHRSSFGASRGSSYGGSSRFGRDLGSDLASMISSPGRATTSTTLETASSIWSHGQSNSRSVTSASLLSRPPSTFEDVGLNRLTDHSLEKATFLENLQQDLAALLLSDLGCPVWSCGSETDSWMDSIRQTSSIVERLEQRAVMACLLSEKRSRASHTAAGSKAGQKLRARSQSVAASRRRSPPSGPIVSSNAIEKALTDDRPPITFSYLNAFNDILSRMRDHVDPNLKLKAVYDLNILAQALQRSQQETMHGERQAEGSHSGEPPRRRSLNPSLLSANLSRRDRPAKPGTVNGSDSAGEENSTVQFLKGLLIVLRPKTIFRDLQYIAAFVSSPTLDDTEMGRAFLHVGLAALAWKDEVCRAMVDVADRIVARDSIKRGVRGGARKEPSILKAMEYWMIGAREGNAIAQRELASVYLTHPDVPPIVSLPLALSSEIFKSEMRWDDEEERRRSSQAVCLALHWMQQAAENGDKLAQTKLEERRESRSIR